MRLLYHLLIAVALGSYVLLCVHAFHTVKMWYWKVLWTFAGVVAAALTGWYALLAIKVLL